MIFIFLGIIVFLVLYIIYTYNSLVKYSYLTDEAWKSIGIFLQMRFDLIPNLVETAKAYAKYESKTLEKIIGLRTQFMNIDWKNMPKEAMDLSNQLSNTLKSIFAVAEAYPELKADKGFLKIQEDILSCENKIAYSRSKYNQLVSIYNTKIKTFPTILVASILGFKTKDYFEAVEESKTAPKLDFSDLI